MKQIVPGIYTFSGLYAGRVYAIEDADGLTLVDSGLSLAAPKVLRQLGEHGFKAEDVKRILVTHAHPDHIGGLHELHELTGAQVIASEKETPVVEGQVAIGMLSPYREILEQRKFKTPPMKFPPTPVSRVVREGDRLEEVLGGLQVLLTPGHALGHVTYWQPERRIAFCGDVMMNLLGLTLPFSFVTPDMDEDRRSVRRIASLQPSILLFGHGEPLMENTARKIAHFSDKVNRP